MTETTDLNKSAQYTLSIRLSTDGFSFFAAHTLDATNATSEDYETNDAISLTANLKEAVRQKEWLNRPFKRVNVLMSDKRFTFMPLEFFDEEAAETVFYHNHPKRSNETVLYNIRPHNNLAILFGMDKSICHFLQSQYADVHFYSQASPLSDLFAAKSRQGNSRKMFVHLRKHAADIFCFEHGQLLLGNSLQCNHTADCIYFLLNLWKTLGFDQEHDELHLAGLLADKVQLLAELRRFIRLVIVMNPSTNLDLQTITTCE